MMLISESRQLIKQLDFDNFRHLTLSSASSHPQITQRYIFQAVLLEKSLLENEACMMAHRSPISFSYTPTHTKKKKKKVKSKKNEYILPLWPKIKCRHGIPLMCSKI
jgi:hypothetical protein